MFVETLTPTNHPGPAEIPKPDTQPNILPPADPQPPEPGRSPDIIPGKEPLTKPSPTPRELPPLNIIVLI